MFCFQQPSLAAEIPIAQLARSQSQRIQNLMWISDSLQVISRKDPENGRMIPMAVCRGRFVREDWTLIGPSGETMPVKPDGQFFFLVPIRSAKRLFQMTAVGPRGEAETEKLALIIPNWEKWLASEKSATIKPQAPFSFVPSLGVSSIVYKETGTPDFRELALTGKVSFQIAFSNEWNLGANVFLNFMPVSASRTDITVRFFGANLRIGYALPFIRNPWRLSLMTGLYYSQMFVTQSRFGYTPMVYPQFYPVLSRRLGTGHSLMAYSKFVPVNGIKEAEISGGLGLTSLLKNGHSVSTMLDYSVINFTPVRNSKISSSSLSLSIGYRL